jgi:hypothetical protein
MDKGNTPRTAADAFSCHIILPGLVQGKRNQIIAKRRSSKNKNTSMRVFDFLNALASHNDPVSALFLEARAQFRTIRKRTWNKRVPTIGSQKKKCEKLINEGRFSTAMAHIASIIDLEE